MTRFGITVVVLALVSCGMACGIVSADENVFAPLIGQWEITVQPRCTPCTMVITAVDTDGMVSGTSTVSGTPSGFVGRASIKDGKISLVAEVGDWRTGQLEVILSNNQQELSGHWSPPSYLNDPNASSHVPRTYKKVVRSGERKCCSSNARLYPESPLYSHSGPLAPPCLRS